MSNKRKSSIVDWLPQDMLATEADLKVGQGFSVLGMAWDPEQHEFCYNVSLEKLD